MDSIRDALMVTASGRKVIVQVDDEVRTKAIALETARENARKGRIAEFEKQEQIRLRVRTLKDLVHFTFVQFPRDNHRPVRFDVYQSSKDYIRSIAVDGGDTYERLTRTLQFAHTSKDAFDEAVIALSDGQHDFSDYESSDAILRHA